ncbi:hypothetical protein GQ44DRAFT_733951 [Phaeosphaeriaceae sp. PMI808]|nr:hypothetical protein GQ44DRAFT_733951 [Phaeosphaeriaceae sp. PMI808]
MCNVERIIERKSQDYLARHSALDDILSQDIQTAISSAVVNSEPYDSTTLFIDMLSQATVLVLPKALSYLPRDKDACIDIHEIYGKKAAKSAEALYNSTQNVYQLGCFKVHPFTPIVLFISAQFVRSWNGLNEISTIQFKAISAALYNL